MQGKARKIVQAILYEAIAVACVALRWNWRSVPAWRSRPCCRC
jgi:hypothetical protein